MVASRKSLRGSNKVRYGLLSAAALLAASQLAAQFASAAAFTWSSASNATWATANSGNWTPAWTANATTDTFVFNANPGSGQNITLGMSNINFTSITFGASGWNITGGADTLTGVAASTITSTTGSSTIDAIIAGAATSVTYTGGGSIVLGATNTYTGKTIVTGGTTLVLDFSQSGAPATNIIPTANSLTLTGANFTLLAKASTIDAQTFSSLITNAGFSTITNTLGSGTSLTLNLGVIGARAAGEALELINTGTITTTSTTFLSNNVLVSAASSGIALATVGTTDWASLAASGSPRNIIGLSTGAGYQTGNANYVAASNVDVGSGDAPSAFTVNTLRFNNNNSTLALTGANTVNTGGILVTSAVTTGVSITGGSGTSIKPGGGKELVIYNYGNSLSIDSVLADNSTSAVTFAGGASSTTVVSEAATYAGVTNIDNTKVQLGSAGNIGTTGNLTFTNGGTLDLHGLNQSVGNINGAAGSVITNTAGSTNSVFTVTAAGNQSSVYTGTFSDGPSSAKLSLTFNLTNATGIVDVTASGATFSNTGDTTLMGNKGGLLNVGAQVVPGNLILQGGGMSQSTQTFTNNIKLGSNGSFTYGDAQQQAPMVFSGPVTPQTGGTFGTFTFYTGTSSLHVLGITGVITDSNTSDTLVFDSGFDNNSYTIPNSGAAASNYSGTGVIFAGTAANAFAGTIDVYGNALALKATGAGVNAAIIGNVNIGNGTSHTIAGAVLPALILRASNQIADTSIITIANDNSGTGRAVGVFDLAGFSETIGGLSSQFSGAGGYVGNSSANSADSTLTLNVASGTQTFSGNLVNAVPTVVNAAANGFGTFVNTNSRKLNLVMSGAGTQILAGTNTYTGTTSITSGVLKITGNGSNSVTTVSGTGTLVAGSSNALGLVSAVGTPFGAVGAGTVATTTVSAGGTLDLAGQSLPTNIVLSGGTLTNSSTAATITNGLAGITFSTSSTNYSLGTTLSISGGGGTSAAATALLGIGSNSSFVVDAVGSGYTAAPAASVSGGGDIANPAAVTPVRTGTTVTGITLNNLGMGFTSIPTVTISGGGGTGATAHVNDGTFQLAAIQMTNAGSGYTSAPTVSASTGTATFTPVLSGISLSGTSSQIGGTGDIAINGIISGVGGGFTKINGNTVTLGAVNSYTGSTTISSGKLSVSTAGTINTSSGVTVNGSTANFNYNSSTAFTPTLTLTQGTLSGAGTISASGGVTAATNAVVAPGNSPGILTFTTGLNFNSGGTYLWANNAGNTAGTAGTTFSQIAVTAGTATINSGANLSLSFNNTTDFTNAFWSTAETFDLIAHSGAGSVSGTFANGNITISGTVASLSNAANTLSQGTFSDAVSSGDLILTWTPTPTGSANFGITSGAVTLNVLKGAGGGSVASTVTVNNSGTIAGDASFSGLSSPLTAPATITGVAASGTGSNPLSLNTTSYGSGSQTLTVSPSSSPSPGTTTVAVNYNVGQATADNSNSMGSFGTPLSAAVTAGTGAYNGLSSKVTATSGSGGGGMLGSEAIILQGNAAGNTTVSMAWRTRTTNEVYPSSSNPPFTGPQSGLMSDVVQISGTNGDTYALQMSYVPSAEASTPNLGELVGGYWVNAGTTPTEIMGAYNPGTDFVLGDWGVDTTNDVVWAVVSGDGTFAAVPEPASLSLLGLGAVGLLATRRRRR